MLAYRPMAPANRPARKNYCRNPAFSEKPCGRFPANVVDRLGKLGILGARPLSAAGRLVEGNLGQGQAVTVKPVTTASLPPPVALTV
jgi:hypothetical protein